MKRALSLLALLRFFPQNNSPALAWVAELLAEMCSDEAALERAVDAILRQHSEWPGPAEFQRLVGEALYPRGMWHRGDKWIPSPENGPEFDIIGPDGSRHWHKGVYRLIPEVPYDWPRGPGAT